MTGLELLTNAELIAAARASLTDPAWDRLVGGAESETTALRNRLALDRLALRPRVLVGVTDIDTSATYLGQRLRIPVLLANIGNPEALWPGGAGAAVEAAWRFGVVPFLSSGSGQRAVGAGGTVPGPWILEISAHDSPEILSRNIDRAEELGSSALCLGLVPYPFGRRERRRFQPRPIPRHTRDAWKAVANVAGRSRLPLVAKGVMCAADARLAIDHGCASIYVSNDGGRVLDHCEATIDMLPEIVEAVDGRAEVIVDGGFMRGTDVLKALASGARAVAIGRLQGLGLAAGGSAGLVRVLEILEEELRVSMSLLGAVNVDLLGSSHLHHDELPVQLPHVTGAFSRTPVEPSPTPAG